MTHKLTIELHDDVFDSLTKKSSDIGKSPESVTSQIVEAWVRDEPFDPLEEFIGAYSSDVPGWTVDHDKLLGEYAARKLGRKPMG